MEFYHKIISEFPNIPEDLLIFFYMKGNVGCFIVKNYLFGHDDKIIKDINFDMVREEISNVDDLTIKLLSFYFPDHNEKIAFGEEEFLSKVSDLVNISEYPDPIKHKLLSFFINPQKNVQKLVYELVAKETLLSRYYEKNYKKIQEIQESFNMAEFSDKLKSVNGKNYVIDKVDTVNISVSLIAKNVLMGEIYNNSSLYIIGSDYLDCLDMLLNRKTLPGIDIFGKITSDKNRLEILEMLNNSVELTTTEIAKNLSVSVNAAYYHLDMMIQADMLFSRNEGRTVFYRVNKQYFKNISEAILKYS